MDTNREEIQLLKDVGEKKYYKMSEVLEFLKEQDQEEVPRTTVNGWLNEFEDLLGIKRNNRNHRLFTMENIKLLKAIKKAKKKGATNEHIREKLQELSKSTNATKETALTNINPNSFGVKEIENNAKIQEVIQYIIDKSVKEAEAKFEEMLNRKLEEQEQRIRGQIESENKKLMDYIATTRKEEKKKSFWIKCKIYS